MWGLGNEKDIEARDGFRSVADQMAVNSRKIDKKKLIEGDFAGQALEKNFQFRDQVEGDVQDMHKELKDGLAKKGVDID